MKKILLIFLVFLFCRTFFCIQTAQAQEKSYSISGFVTNKEGAGISGVEIRTSGKVRDVKHTDPTGYYRFDEIPSEAKIEVSAKKDEYSVSPAVFRISSVNSNRIVNFKAVKISYSEKDEQPAASSFASGETKKAPLKKQSYEIKGKAAYYASGLVGVKVSAKGARSSEVLTDSNGNYSIKDFKPSPRASLFFSKEGYKFNPEESDLSNLASDAVINTEASIETFKVSGVISEGKNFIEDVSVKITDGNEEFDAVTDEKGYYEIGKLPYGGNFLLLASKEGVVISPLKFPITKLTSDKTVNFSANVRKFKISGYVTDENDGPVIKANVDLSMPEEVLSKKTDAKGYYEFKNVPAFVPFTLKASKDGYSDSGQQNVAPIDSNEIYDFQIVALPGTEPEKTDIISVGKIPQEKKPLKITAQDIVENDRKNEDKNEKKERLKREKEDKEKEKRLKDEKDQKEKEEKLRRGREEKESREERLRLAKEEKEKKLRQERKEKEDKERQEQQAKEDKLRQEKEEREERTRLEAREKEEKERQIRQAKEDKLRQEKEEREERTRLEAREKEEKERQIRQAKEDKLRQEKEEREEKTRLEAREKEEKERQIRQAKEDKLRQEKEEREEKIRLDAQEKKEKERQIRKAKEDKLRQEREEREERARVETREKEEKERQIRQAKEDKLRQEKEEREERTRLETREKEEKERQIRQAKEDKLRQAIEEKEEREILEAMGKEEKAKKNAAKRREDPKQKSKAEPAAVKEKPASDKAKKIKTVKIRGVVASKYSAASGIKLTIEPGGYETVTDEKGKFSFDDIPENSRYILKPFSPDMSFEPENAVFEDVRSNITQDFAPCVSIEGETFYEGKPISGVTIFFNDVKTAETNQFGKFKIFPVEYNSPVSVSVSKAGYPFYPLTFSVKQADKHYDGLKFFVSYAISGKVTMSDKTLGLSNAEIEISGSSNTVTATNFSGNFSIQGLEAAGTYKITPKAGGYTFTPASRDYVSLKENHVGQNFTASKETYNITGSVTLGGKPVKNATISITKRALKYFTDEDGNFEIKGLDYGGPYTVTVQSKEHRYDPITIDLLKEDASIDFSTDLFLSGSVMSDGKPVAGVTVDINGSKYKTDENGKYTVKGLKYNGTYLVSLQAKGLLFQPFQKEYSGLRASVHNEVFETSVVLSGRITSGSQPLENVDVVLGGAGRSAQTYKTDSNGYYTISNAKIGRDYFLEPSLAGYVFTPAKKEYVNLSEGKLSENFKASEKTAPAAAAQAQEAAYSLKGSVYNVFQRGIKGAVLTTSDGLSAATDSKGGYRIDGLKSGKKTSVTPQSDEYNFYPESFEVSFKSAAVFNDVFAYPRKIVKPAAFIYGGTDSVVSSANSVEIVAVTNENGTIAVQIIDGNDNPVNKFAASAQADKPAVVKWDLTSSSKKKVPAGEYSAVLNGAGFYDEIVSFKLTK